MSKRKLKVISYERGILDEANQITIYLSRNLSAIEAAGVVRALQERLEELQP